MINFIEFDHEKCDGCYKCLRICPTKAISFHEDERHIIDNLCIKCGLCQQSCPREALSIRSSEKSMKILIEQGKTVAVSLAPSFAGAFGLEDPLAVVGVLKSMGVAIVEETAIGAAMVAGVYDTYISEKKSDVYITSCCPSANYLIEEHYPELIPNVIPVVSPMIAHGRSMKERYGEDVKIVFIGPCMAKIAEAEEMSGAIDLVMTFEELYQIVLNEGKKLTDFKSQPFDATSYGRGRSFPLGGSLENDEATRGYSTLHVDGIEACKSILNEVKKGIVKKCCIEINICEGSCMNGPDMPKNGLGRFSRELHMHKYIDAVDKKIAEDGIYKVPSMFRSFKDKKARDQDPDESTIKTIMSKMGKFMPEDELNCGACGYKSCHDKAIAVFKGYSDVENCLPYLRDKAESMQNTMIEHSPNAVVLIDAQQNIMEVNPSFSRILNKDNLPYEGLPISLFVDHPIFDKVRQEKTSIQNQNIYVSDIDCYFLVNAIYLSEEDMIIAFMTDITTDEKNKTEYKRVKEETLLKTQEVIDNQMRVAQEIASLLGETTAETKMSLKSLNELVMYDWSGVNGNK